MSAGGDNCIKQWVFDAADNSARLLKFRSGHSAPPTCVAHYGEGLRLLSAGRDRAFRVFSTIQVGRLWAGCARAAGGLGWFWAGCGRAGSTWAARLQSAACQGRAGRAARAARAPAAHAGAHSRTRRPGADAPRPRPGRLLLSQDQQSRELSQKHSARRAKRLKLREADVKLPRVVALGACQVGAAALRGCRAGGRCWQSAGGPLGSRRAPRAQARARPRQAPCSNWTSTRLTTARPRQVRERDWCNVITAHDGDTRAYTWRLQHFTIGEAALVPPAGELQGQPAAPVTSVAISSCGNFGLVGSASGRIDRYNMQSGAYRGSYKRPGGARPPLPPGAWHSCAPG
jgi:hypothetical protein